MKREKEEEKEEMRKKEMRRNARKKMLKSVSRKITVTKIPENVTFRNGYFECDRTSGFLRVVFTGDGAVGKTCLVTKIYNGKFPEDYPPTSDSILFHFNIWDTAGEEITERTATLWFKETDICCLCYSVVNRNTLLSVKEKWERELRKYREKDSAVLLVGTKTDLREDERYVKEMGKEGRRIVTTEEGERFAKEVIKADGFIETSAKTGKNCGRKDAVFQKAILEAYYRKIEALKKEEGDSRCGIM